MKYVSVYYFPDRVWVVMEAGVNNCLEVSLFLLPIFLLIRFFQDYLQSSLQEELTLRALISALSQGVFLLFLLLSYKELIQLLDSFIYELMELLGNSAVWKAYVSKTSDRLAALKEKEPTTWWITRSITWGINGIRKLFSWTVLLGVRTVLMHIRGYFLLFSTQVGPLAIAASILPGKLGGTLQVWFKTHLTFLAWGITMAILDRTFASIDLAPYSIPGSFHDLITATALFFMYLFIGPLTSIYIGSSVGSSFLSAGLSPLRQPTRWATRQAASLAAQLIKGIRGK
jgi:hypothetical protein